MCLPLLDARQDALVLPAHLKLMLLDVDALDVH